MLFLEKDTHPDGYAGECLLSKALLARRGRRRRFHRHLRGDFHFILASRSGGTALTAKIAKNNREGREENLPSPRRPGMPFGRRSRKLTTIIELSTWRGRARCG